MDTLIICLIVISTVITTIVNFAKPAYEQFAGKRATTVNIGLSFALGVASAFAILPYTGVEVGVGATILLGLGLGTGSTVFYDLWKLIQNLGSNKKDTDVVSNKTWEPLSNNEEVHEPENNTRN